MTIQRTCTAFCGARQVASGPYSEVALEVQQLGEPVVIFDDETGRSIDFDLRGTADEIRNRFSGAPPAGKEPPRGPGRPRLGVVAREVTLLPRHWEWLGTQPGGASVALRKLVEAARMDKSGAEAVRRAQAAEVSGLPPVARTPAFSTVIGLLLANSGAQDLQTAGAEPGESEFDGYFQRVGAWLKSGF